jgi:hypothetical protein
MQLAIKKMLKNSNEKLTQLPHAPQLELLHHSLQETSDEIQAEFTSPNDPTRVRPAPSMSDIETQACPDTANAQVQTCSELGLGGFLATSAPAKTKKSKRCRKCGLRESDNNKFKQWHERPSQPKSGNRSDNLRNTAENQVHKFCTTPPNERKPGYPLEEHE